MKDSILDNSGEILQGKSEYYSCWYNKLLSILFLLAFLTFGIADTFSSLNMIEKKGVICEGNLIVRFIILHYGTSDFIFIKIFVTLVILYFPFLIRNDTGYWMISGYLVSFVLAGIFGTVLNIKAMNNETPFLSPGEAMTLFMLSVLILTNIGDAIDKRVHPKTRPFYICLLKDIVNIFDSIINISKGKE